MKGCLLYFLIFTNFIYITNASFLKLKESANALESTYDTESSGNYSNELVHGLNDVNELKRIIQDLAAKLEAINEKKDTGPHFKYMEVKMPPKGKELKIKHELNAQDILSVNVMIVNQTSQNFIMRSQVDLMSQKVLYNWYLDKESLVLIRPNNLDFNDSIFLEKANLRVIFTLK